MKFSDLKFSPNLYWQYDAGAGLQLYGNIPDDAKNHVEYIAKSQGCTLFTLITPDGWNSKGKMAGWLGQGIFGYETWVQFGPKGWKEMQIANAQAMTHAVRVLPEIISYIKEMQKNDLKKDDAQIILNDILELAETLKEKS